MDGTDPNGAAGPGDSPGDPLPFARLLAMRPLLEEIGDLKRVRQDGCSLAEANFAAAWGALIAGESPDFIALREVVKAVSGVVLGPVDTNRLADLGLSRTDIAGVLREAMIQRGPALGETLAARLSRGVEIAAIPEAVPEDMPSFVGRLSDTPRAGATFPGKARRVLEPAENHAEHCWTVAVYAALMVLLDEDAPPDDLGAAFLTGLSHHLHNAWVPDGGFAGEEALGRHLATITDEANARALAEIAPPLKGIVAESLAGKDRIDTRAGAAFNAADALDRVLQMAHFERAAKFRLEEALDDLELLHPGPLQSFQQRTLRAAGVLA